MKQILNNSNNIVQEMFEGLLGAYKNTYEQVGDLTAFTYKKRRKGKVSIIVGGGSGHEPSTSGFVGKGLADAVACGQIFVPPKASCIYQTAKAVDEKKGILFIHGCYPGDNMNFHMAEELCAFDGIKTADITVWDDCTSAPKEQMNKRRGIAGSVFVLKIAGAAADMGYDLDEVVRIAEKARNNVNTIGLATSACTFPGEDHPMFEMDDDIVEYGMGIHGEPGMEQIKMQPADILVERMYRELKKEMDLREGQELAVLVNSLGATTLLELYTVYYDLEKLLEEDRIIVYDGDVNSYCTSQEMRGFSISFMKLDEELKRYYDMPCASPYYSKGMY